LAELKIAATRYSRDHSLDAFEAAISRGVSANLCDSVAKLAEASVDGAIEVRIAWSSKLPSRRPPSTSTLGTELVPALTVASDHLRRIEPESGVELEGVVQRLDREQITVSDVSIRCDIDGRSRLVHLVLEGEPRKRAIQAFDRGLRIRCTGTLDRRATYILRAIKNVRVLEEDSDPTLPPVS
jgi:hypothetical protein